MLLLKGNELNETELCPYLDSIRTNFSVCCERPSLTMQNSDWDQCNAACEAKALTNNNDTDDNCCMVVCSLLKTGIVSLKITDESKDASVTLHQEAIVFAFMFSNNDTWWEPVIKESVDQCHRQFNDTEINLVCGGVIPLNFWDIIDCSRRQNFLNCPIWNTDNVTECEHTREFAQKCTSERSFESYD